MRVRGLKLYWGCNIGKQRPVAPHAGAWIETICTTQASCGTVSHPMRVRWLKCKLLYSVGEFVLALHSR